MKDKKISSGLQMKIRRFVEFQHEEERYRSNIENIVFESLPHQLKEKLYFEANFKRVKEIKLFNKFSEQFLMKLTMKFEEINLPRDEILFHVNKYDY